MIHAPGADLRQLDSEDVPSGWSKVPVKVVDNGEEIMTEMVAGSVGIHCSCSGKLLEKGGTGLDTMQPQTGWWMFEQQHSG